MTAARSATATTFEVKQPRRQGSAATVTPGSGLLAARFMAKVPTRSWEILGSRSLVASAQQAVGAAVRRMQQARRDPRAGGVHTLELQCGPTSALLSMLASRAGAARVLACDVSPHFVALCAEVAAANGLGPPGFLVAGVHPSKLHIGGSGSPGVPRPVDLLLLPLPEVGLFQGGLLKVIRSVQQNSNLLARDAAVFPARVKIWAQVVELTHAANLDSATFDCSAHLSLLPPSALLSPGPIDLESTPHHELCAPVRVASVDLEKLCHGDLDPAAPFEVNVSDVSVSRPGRASAIVWWWSLDLCRESKSEKQKLTSAPGSAFPWYPVSGNTP